MKKTKTKINIVPKGLIENKIFLVRGQNVMVDSDLAELYDVETKQLTRQVRRNIKRFPSDFMFQLTEKEFLRCQIGTSRHGGRRYKPYVFTEQGVAMLSSVLNSERAIQVNIQIIRTFTKLREILLTHTELKRKIEAMESKYDKKFKIIFQAIKQMLELPEKQKSKKIGF